MYNTNKTIKKEFVRITVLATWIWICCELLFVYLWVREYSPEVLAILQDQSMIVYLIQIIIYFPVFIIVSYSFYKYRQLSLTLDDTNTNYTIERKKDVLLSIGGIALLSYLIHPLVILSHLSIFIVIIVWLLLVLIITNYLVSFFAWLWLLRRFILWTTISTILWVYFLSLLVTYWHLSFSQSIINTYSQYTFILPGTNIITVVTFGVMIFMALMIAFVKYWKVVRSNTLPHD